MKANPLILIPLLALGALGLSQIRGVRNKNWLNIKYNAANDWLGQVGVDNKGFVVFSSPVFSLRAGLKILATYNSKGVNTIQKIVERFAPAADNNNVPAYVEFLSRNLHLAPNATVYPTDYPALIKYMAKMETGVTVSPNDLAKAVQML